MNIFLSGDERLGAKPGWQAARAVLVALFDQVLSTGRRLLAGGASHSGG